MATKLDMAEQQLLGFHHAKSGFTIEELIESMGLTITEWRRMKIMGMIDYLESNMRDEIDNHFLN